MKNLLILILLFTSIAVNAQKKKLTDEEKIYGLSLIWQEVNYNYAYMENYNLDWDSVYIANIPKVMAAKNRIEYYTIMSKIMNSFHEGHTFVGVPVELAQQMYGYVSISMSFINGKYYVTKFLSEYKDKIFIGSILTSVNGYDVDEYFNKFVFPNNNLAEHIAKRQSGKGRFFVGLPNKKLTATFLNSNGKTVSLKLKRVPYFADNSETIEVPKMYEDTVFLHKKYGDISYIRINSFKSNTPNTSFAKIIDSLKNSKAIIFDIRGNRGGSTPLEIISYFSDKKSIPLWWGQMKVNRSYYKATGASTYLHGDSLAKAKNFFADYVTLSHFEGSQYNYSNNTNGDLKDIPVVVLCNYLTESAAESFIIMLKQVASVTVIGEPTAGSSTMPLEVPLPGGGFVKISSVKGLDENGKPYTYTQPDIVHIPSLEDEKKGTDSVLQKALDFINDMD